MKNILQKGFFRFIVVGGLSTVIDYSMYMLLSRHLLIELSKGISMMIASIFSYSMNKRFTFRNHKRTNSRYIIRFYEVVLINLIINMTVNTVVYRMTDLKTPAFILATCAGMAVNYFGQRFFVFYK